MEKMVEKIKYFMSAEALIYYNELAVESIDFKILLNKRTICSNNKLNIINNMTNTDFSLAFATKKVTIEFNTFGPDYGFSENEQFVGNSE